MLKHLYIYIRQYKLLPYPILQQTNPHAKTKQ